jgi:hypothetical protein
MLRNSSLAKRRLSEGDDLEIGGKVSLNVGVMTETIVGDFVTTWESTDDVSLKKGWQVLLTMGAIFGLAVIGIALGDAYDKKASKVETITKHLISRTAYIKARSTNHPSQMSSSRSLNMDVFEKCWPVVFNSEPFATKFVTENKRNHRWIAVIFHYSPNFSRVNRLMSLLVTMIIMVFAQAVTFNLAEPDDGTCEVWSNEQDCLAEKSRLASDASMCYWTNSTTSCHFQEPSEDITRILYVAIVSSLLSTPFVILETYMLLYILNSSHSKKESHKKIALNHVTPIVPTFTAENNYFPNSAESELSSLYHAIQAYRNNLTKQLLKEFDGKK